MAGFSSDASYKQNSPSKASILPTSRILLPKLQSLVNYMGIEKNYGGAGRNYGGGGRNCFFSYCICFEFCCLCHREKSSYYSIVCTFSNWEDILGNGNRRKKIDLALEKIA